MNVRVDFRDETTDWYYGLEVDSARFGGIRSAFGPSLQISTLRTSQPVKIVPLLFFGSFSWANETDGLVIPPQPLPGGHGALTIPVTDQQLAAIERVRQDSEPVFTLTLSMTGQTEDKTVRLLGGRGRMHSVLYPIAGEDWRKALDACGYGRIRIVELPPVRLVDDAVWAAAADALVRASVQIRSGDYAGSTTSSRGALERIIEALEGRLRLERKGTWGQRVDRVASTVQASHVKNGNDPYDLHAKVISSLHGFASGGAHRLVASRADAEYASEVTTALYRHLVRMPIPQVREPDDDDHDQKEDV